MVKRFPEALAVVGDVGLIGYEVIDSLRHNGKRYKIGGTVYLTEAEKEDLVKRQSPVIGEAVEIQPESESTDGSRGKDALDGGGGAAGDTGEGGDSTGREPGKEADDAGKTDEPSASKAKGGAKAGAKTTAKPK